MPCIPLQHPSFFNKMELIDSGHSLFAWRTGEYLDSLAETHLICKDAVQVIVIQAHHPLQPHHLVLAQRCVVGSDKHSRLLHLFINAMCQSVVPRLHAYGAVM